MLQDRLDFLFSPTKQKPKTYRVMICDYGLQDRNLPLVWEVSWLEITFFEAGILDIVTVNMVKNVNSSIGALVNLRA